MLDRGIFIPLLDRATLLNKHIIASSLVDRYLDMEASGAVPQGIYHMLDVYRHFQESIVQTERNVSALLETGLYKGPEELAYHRILRALEQGRRCCLKALDHDIGKYIKNKG